MTRYFCIAGTQYNTIMVIRISLEYPTAARACVCGFLRLVVRK